MTWPLMAGVCDECDRPRYVNSDGVCRDCGSRMRARDGWGPIPITPDVRREIHALVEARRREYNPRGEVLLPGMVVPDQVLAGWAR